MVIKARMRPIRSFLAPLLLLAALLFSAIPPAAAQSSAATDLEALVGTIEDPAAREKLVGQLKAMIAAQKAEAAPAETTPMVEGVIGALSEHLARASRSVVATADVLRDAPRISRWLEHQVSDPAAIARWKAVFLHLTAALAAGWLAEWIGRALLRRARRRVAPYTGEGLLMRAIMVLLGFLLDLLPLVAFAAGAYGTLTLLGAVAEARVVALTIANAYVASRIVITLAEWLLIPPMPVRFRYRLEDETAHYLYIWVRRFVLVVAIGYFTAEALLTLGLPRGGYVGLLKVLGLVVWAMIVLLILQNRAAVSAVIAGQPAEGEPGRLAALRRRLADVWHPLAIVYAVALYLIWAFEIRDGFPYMLRGTLVSIAALILAAAANRGLRAGTVRLFAVRADLRERLPGLEARANRYVPILQGVLSGILWFVALLVIASGWGANVAAWIEDGFGRRLVGSTFSILLVGLLSIVIWEGASAAIERYLTQAGPDGKPLQRSSRVRSLLPVMRNLIFVLLATMVVLITLSELGINIAPLLAGAGVVGLAIGFGAQTLVKDVITGAFILFEDSVAVGDIVRVGQYAGLVEALSIRSIRLRDFNGNVYTVPFSSVAEITNMTKDFSFYAFDLGVAYREDTDEVSEVLRQIGREMMEDPAFGPMIMEPLEVVGVDRFADSAVIIKGRIKTYPIRQWVVGRELNRRIKKRFDELGIEIPFPHTTVYFGEDRKGEAPPARLRMERKAGRSPA